MANIINKDDILFLIESGEYGKAMQKINFAVLNNIEYSFSDFLDGFLCVSLFRKDNNCCGEGCGSCFGPCCGFLCVAFCCVSCGVDIVTPTCDCFGGACNGFLKWCCPACFA